MKIKLLKVGSLLYYSYQTHKEMPANELWLFDSEFKERSNAWLNEFGIYEHYRDLDLRLYIGTRQSSDLESRILRIIKKFEDKCLILGLVNYIKIKNPDIVRVSQLISMLNKPERIINADLKLMIMNEISVSVVH